MPCPLECWDAPCFCADARDRISASLVHVNSPRYVGNNMPLYSSNAGIVMSPTHNKMMCAWASDAGTMSRTCDPLGLSDKCVPGCYTPPGDTGGVSEEAWCRDEADPSNCAHRPSQLDIMMRKHAKANTVTYNEIVFEAATYVARLPVTIEAVFWVREGANVDGYCPVAGQYCERYARETHEKLTRIMGLEKDQIPLLMLDPQNWNEPFSVPVD